ncbi:mavicyanin-like [Mercurialis annua]|uniref:mavicyanin-like n=1 Tax=Mercurialis annua TaxID=3986 RepID=UPI00215E18E3|nr:mavicyanin-like [Mercurialis annua]
MVDKKTKILKNYYSVFLVILFINASFFKCVRSEVYTVGDGEGWVTSSNYGSWSQKYNFTVGDVLVFKYLKEQHNTYEVTEATYRSCDTSSGVIAKYESGNDEVNLALPKKYWFLCNVAGHCFGGMRLVVDVKPLLSSTSDTNNTNTDSSANAPIEQPPPPTSAANNSLEKWGFFTYFIAFWIFIKLYG